MKKLICGIDFGTTKSGLAIIEDDVLNIVRNIEYQDAQGNITRLGAWARPTEMLITTGILRPDELAYHLLQFNLEGTVDYGTTINQPGVKERFLSGSLKQHLDREVEFAGRTLRINELVTIFLRRLVDRIRGKAESEVYAVIGVPAEFNYKKRKSLVCSAHSAGFKKVLLLPEPLAGILAVMNKEHNEKESVFKDKQVLVIDYGGGTCNYAVIDFRKQTNAKILHAGAVPMGGETITEKLMNDYVPKDIEQEVDRTSIYEAFSKEKVKFGHQTSERERSEGKLTIRITSTEGTHKIQPTIKDFDKKIREAVTSVRDEVRRTLKTHKERLIDPLDAVVFLGESRHLYCFKDIFWDSWLSSIKPTAELKPKQYGLGGESSVHASSQMVTEGCALFADRVFVNLLGNVFSASNYILPFVIRTQWDLSINLNNLDDQKLPFRLWHLNNPLKISSDKRLPFTHTVHFQILEPSEGFKIQFKADGDQTVGELETYTVTPKRAGEMLPAYAFVDLRFRVRRDGLIEIKHCIASRSILRSIFGRQNGRDSDTEEDNEKSEAVNVKPGIIIPLIWKSDFEHLDCYNST